MLMIKIPDQELYDENINEFVYLKGQSIQIEHSLVSISKWESKWCKPFLTTKDKTDEELIDYVRCMTITQNVDPCLYNYIPSSVYKEIEDYINAKMTATWFGGNDKSHSREVVTSEVIYYWMTVYNIPFECQKWHLTRLLTLIKVCNINNQPKKKMGRKEMLSSRAALNASRKKALNTKG